MSKYIDAEKLKTRIKRQMNKCIGRFGIIRKLPEYWCLKNIHSLIDSLQQEQPDKYETALEKAREWMPNVNQGGHAILIDIFPELGEGLDPRYGSRKQEQPEVELDREIIKYKVPFTDESEYLNETTLDAIARHFYDLGLNTRKP